MGFGVYSRIGFREYFRWTAYEAGWTDEYQRLCRLERSGAPTQGELLLAIPQDDEEFERLSLAECPRRWGTTALTC